MWWYRKILHISYIDHVTSEEVTRHNTHPHHTTDRLPHLYSTRHNPHHHHFQTAEFTNCTAYDIIPLSPSPIKLCKLDYASFFIHLIGVCFTPNFGTVLSTVYLSFLSNKRKWRHTFVPALCFRYVAVTRQERAGELSTPVCSRSLFPGLLLWHFQITELDQRME